MSERAQSWRNALFAGTFFGLTYGVAMAFFNGQLPPASPGDMAAIVANMVVAGAVFGLLLGLFMISPIAPKAGDIALQPGESLEHSGPANHFQKFEARGGRLALTKSHLLFQPHAINVQRDELRIPRSEIASIAAVRTFGIVPNGIAVTLKSGRVEKFVVNNRGDWVARLSG
jgi:hypothetical protein